MAIQQTTKAVLSAEEVIESFLRQTAHLNYPPAKHYALAAVWAWQTHSQHGVALLQLIEAALTAYHIAESPNA